MDRAVLVTGVFGTPICNSCCSMRSNSDDYFQGCLWVLGVAFALLELFRRVGSVFRVHGALQKVV